MESADPPRRPSDVTPSIVPRLVAGSIGSIVTALAVTPLEVVKVRQQEAARVISTNNLPPNVTPCPRGCGTFVLNNGLLDCVLPKNAVPYFDQFGRPTLPPKNYNSLGTFGMLRQIFRTEGFRGIYSGLTPTLVMSVPNTVLYFTSYDEIVTRIRRRVGRNDGWIPLVSGSSARLLASTVTAPLELIRTRQASLIGQSEKALGIWGEFRLIVSAEGAGALFRGLTPTLWRDVPFSAIYWFCLEHFKIQWRNHGDNTPNTPLRHAGEAFVNGAASGMIAAACTSPFDVVKTRRQTAVALMTDSAAAQDVVCHHNGAAAYKPPVVNTESGTLSVMKDIVHSEGVQGLWRGNTTRMIKVAPACAIMISCYELGKRIME